MSKYVSMKDFDWVLLALLLAISGLGLVQIYSTTVHTKFAGAHLKQLYWLLFGLGLMFFLCLYDYHDLLNHMPILYIISLLMLVVVLAFGADAMGARRWIHIGGFSFQVSEPVKLVIILLLARFFTDIPQEEVTLADALKVFGVVAIP